MKYFNAIVAICACTVAAASAQTLGVDKNPVNLSAQLNGSAVTQTLNVTGSGSFNLSINYPTAPIGWLTVSPAINVPAPAALTLTANPTGIAAGTYAAILTIFNGTNRIDVTVTLAVSSITVAPASLQFASQIGSTLPVPQTLTLSGGSNTPYNAAATTTSGGSWLLITATGGSAGSTATGTSPGTISVSLNSTVVSTLAPATYNGNVAVTPSGSSTGAINVPVTLVVSPAPTVTVSPASVSLFYQVGGSNNSAQQTVTLSQAGSQALTFSIVASVDFNPSGKTWFFVSPGQNGNIPPSGSSTTLTFTYDTTAILPAGTYTGKATLSTPGGTPASQDIPVTLTVSNTPLLAPSTSGLNFNYQLGTSAPAPQNLTVTSTSGATPLTLAAVTNGSSGNWLTVPGTATAGTAFPVAVNPAGLAAGNYTGSITVTSAGASNSPLSIPVTLKITNDAVIVAGINGCSTANQPCPMTFAFQTGQAVPPNQTIQFSSSTGATLNYTTSFSSPDCGGNWLSLVTPTGSTNGAVLASPNVTGVAAGKCNGTITVIANNPSTSAAAPNSPLTIPVALYVSATPLLVVNPNGLTFNGQINGAAPPAQTITLTSTSTTDQVTYHATFTTSTGANWLFVSPTDGTTAAGQNALTVLAFQGILSPGTYSGSVTITATGPGGAAVADSPVTIPVIFNVNAGTISATPTSLNFTQLAGGPAPAGQTVNIAGNPAAINFSVLATADSNGTWLTATPASGGTPGTVQVSASAGSLPVGQYTGKVTITAATPPGATGSPLSIPVTLNVVAAQTLTASPNNVNFAYTVGATAPANQTVAVASTGAAVPFTVKVDQGTGSWLTVTPTSGNTNSNLTLAINPQGLTANKYTATVSISSTASLTPATVTVTLTVINPVPPIATAIVNAASYVAGGVSPGENVVIFGVGLGPVTLAGPAFNPNGSFGTTVSDTQITFDNIPAPILYVSATQSSVMVPYEIAGRANTVVRITYKGVTSDPVTYNVVSAAPGIYTQNAQGTGPGSILNQDNTVNGPSNPAAKGTAVAVYMTGEGSTTPQSTDGAIAGSPGNPLNKPAQTVTATVGGLPANVEYAGSAPGIVYGVMQVNVRLPANTPSGAQPVVITVGNTTTKTGVTVTVQ